jgi:DNA-binding LacI/PurR family transcriptional regulator
MGETAGRLLLDWLRGRKPPQDEVSVEPELVVRDSTGPVRQPVPA